MSRVRTWAWIACFALPACAAYRTEHLGAIAPWPPPQLAPPAPGIALRIYGNLREEAGPVEINSEQLALWRDAALRAYRESGLFREVVDGWEGEGLVAEIGFVVSEGKVGSWPTLFGTNGVQRNALYVSTQFRDAQGRVLGKVELSEAVRFFTARDFVPFLAARNSGRVVREVIYDLQRATLSKAIAEGFLRPGTP
jgi:hypothetical protein